MAEAMKMMYDAGGDLCQKEAKEIKCPTLILHGAKDPLVPEQHPKWFHDAIPGSKLHIFPDREQLSRSHGHHYYILYT